LKWQKAFGDTNMVKKFETLSLCYHTVARSVVAISEHMAGKMSDIVDKSCYFSLCLDEITDQTDITQLLIFVRTVQSEFSAQEELLNLCSFKGTTIGIDIYEAVETTVDKFGGFDKCSSIVTNLIRGDNKSLSHRTFWANLEEMDATYGDLLLHYEVRWLSAGKCLE
jgi:hypothetical protein